MARPSIKGTHVTGTAFKLRPELEATVRSGAKSLSRRIGQTHPKRRTPSPSNAHWLRILIGYAFEHSEKVPAWNQKEAMSKVTQPTALPIAVSLKITEEQRVMLRKIECAVQALDWSVDFNRNAVLNFIVLVYGPMLTQALDDGLYPP